MYLNFRNIQLNVRESKSNWAFWPNIFSRTICWRLKLLEHFFYEIFISKVKPSEKQQNIFSLNLIIKNDMDLLWVNLIDNYFFSIFSPRRPAPAQCHALNGPFWTRKYLDNLTIVPSALMSERSKPSCSWFPFFPTEHGSVIRQWLLALHKLHLFDGQISNNAGIFRLQLKATRAYILTKPQGHYG